MTEGVEFCAFLTTRYLNSKLMGPAHDWVAANMPELPRGLIRISLKCEKLRLLWGKA